MIDLGKISIEQVNEIIQNIDSKSNSDLTKVMDFLMDDFDETKDMIIDLTKHLDNIERRYDLIHKEFKRRTNG